MPLLLRHLRPLKIIVFLILLSLYSLYHQFPPSEHNNLLPKSKTAPPPFLRPPLNLTSEVERKDIKWGEYKYVQIVDTLQDLCSATVMWKQVERVGSRAGRIMIHPSIWSTLPENSTTRYLLRHAEKESFAKLLPMDFPGGIDSRMLAFNLTEYKRVLLLSPGMAIKKQLDEVFLTPMETGSVVAMAYNHTYAKPQNVEAQSSYIENFILLQPSSSFFNNISSSSLTFSRSLGQTHITPLNSTHYGFQTSHFRNLPPSSPPSRSFRYRVFALFTTSSSTAKQQQQRLMWEQPNQARILHLSDPPLPPLPWPYSYSSSPPQPPPASPPPILPQNPHQNSSRYNHLQQQPFPPPLHQNLTYQPPSIPPPSHNPLLFTPANRLPEPKLSPQIRKMVNELMPRCERSARGRGGFGVGDCTIRQVWWELWVKAERERWEVCGAGV